MLVYLDTYDLIDLCRGTAFIDISDLAGLFRANSHQIVFSLETLVEFAAPLGNGQKLEVRRDLNRLEELPHTFVNEGRISDSEIREAINAFSEGREYNFGNVTPFASRLDQALDLHGSDPSVIIGVWRVPTNMILNLRMSEVILNLWSYDRHIFDVQRRNESAWIRLMEQDRAMAKMPALSDHFAIKMAGDLRDHGIMPPAEGVERFARWVYASPSRCPGIRLTYATQHRFRLDKTARPAASDIIDLIRVLSVPYVDYFVTDKKKMTYCRQAARDIGHPYRQLLGNLQAVVTRLAAAC